MDPNPIPGQPPHKFYMEKITDFGELQDLPGFSPEEDIKLHPRAKLENGGLIMPDHEKVIPKFVSDLAKRLASKIMKGQLTSLSKEASPAYIHHYLSNLEVAKNSTTFCRHMKQLVNEPDPVKRLRLLSAHYVME